jgi:hypothetical protein
LKVRLKGAAAKTLECSYSATFVDGSAVGPVSSGETCEAESLAALESFQVVIHPRGSKEAAAKTVAASTEAVGKRPAVEKPAGKRPSPEKIGKPTAKARARA